MAAALATVILNLDKSVSLFKYNLLVAPSAHVD
jgi:hypothetical protein